MDETPQQTAPDEAREEEKLHAQVQVEQTGPCSRLVKIEVPQDEVQKRIDESYDELRKSVFIKGFRVGHVPRHILERRFGDDVLESVKENLIGTSLEDAIQEHGLQLALAPEVDEEQVELAPDKPLRFEVTLEVIPEFTLTGYEGLRVERPAAELTEEDVDGALESFRMRRGEYQTLEHGEVTEDDVAICHAAALQGDEELWSDRELGVSMAAGTIAGMAIEGLADALRGAKPGETRTLPCTLPDTFPVEEHRGKDVTLEITVDEIRRFEAPEATDEWAQSLDFEDLEDLREEIEDELRQRRQADADQAVRQQIDDKLLELADFEVPDGIVDRLTEESKNRLRAQLLYNGVPEDEIDQHVEERAASTRDAAARAARLNFIYQKIAEQEKVFVTEDELAQRIQAIALNYRRRPEEVRRELEASGRLDALRRQMREERVRDYLVEHAQVVEAGAADEPTPQDSPPPEAPDEEEDA